MTIEELTGTSIEKLEAMTVEELNAWFKPFWPTTRPQPKEDKKDSVAPTKVFVKSKAQRMKEAEAMLKKYEGLI